MQFAGPLNGPGLSGSGGQNRELACFLGKSKNGFAVRRERYGLTFAQPDGFRASGIAQVHEAAAARGFA